MRSLPLPPGAGDAALSALCEKDKWKPHGPQWLAAYKSFRSHGGDPWKLTATRFMPPVDKEQRALWKARKSSGAIKKIRGQSRSSCGVCGSPYEVSLDHYLPQKHFPEFAIMSENIVPACTACNSAEKGDVYRGQAAPERFIHPYFDGWADQNLWRVEVSGNLDAPTFRPVPEPGLAAALQPIVRFHLETLLGEKWVQSVERGWDDLPLRVLGPPPRDVQPNAAAVASKFYDLLWNAKTFEGNNAWSAAFYRGVIADPQIATHVADAIAVMQL